MFVVEILRFDDKDDVGGPEQSEHIASITERIFGGASGEERLELRVADFPRRGHSTYLRLTASDFERDRRKQRPEWEPEA